MVYIDDHIWDFDLQEALEAVGDERRQYALRYRQEGDMRQCVAAWLLLQRALSIEYGISHMPPVVYSPGGKPLLSGYQDIHFSLSHCSEAVACVLADHRVGIDVECISSIDDDLLAHTMNDSEQQQITASSAPEVEFTRLWTMKESLYKLHGDSVHFMQGDDPRTLLEGDLVGHRFHTTITPRYVLTCCEALIN